MTIIATLSILLAGSASADGLGTKWRAYRLGSQIGTLETAIKNHARSVELNRSTSRDVNRLKSASSSLASTLRAIRESKETISSDHKTRLEAIRMPTFLERLTVSTNFWGSTGFDPDSVSRLTTVSEMSEQYSTLYKVAGTLGIQIAPLKVTIRTPRGARLTYRQDQPGVDLDIGR